jgi:preprotein translocase SecF subunit
MRPLKLIPRRTNIDFLGLRKLFFMVSIAALAGAALSFFVRDLNYGIDFLGGMLIEVGTPGPADLSAMRDALGGLGLGEVALQEFGAGNDVLIRVARQPGGEEAQNAAVATVKNALAELGLGDLSYRRVEVVGPKVSGELVEAGTIAVLVAVACMLLYILIRFAWQYSIGAVLALVHDVLLTIGMYSITQIEFNLASIAAILTIVGYSINDTVVVYDRVRENLPKYKKTPIADVLNRSINDTLSRTTMTSVTTLLALLALYIFGGDVLAGFTLAMIWGVIVGTYSSVFIAAPLLLLLKVRASGTKDADAATEKARP